MIRHRALLATLLGLGLGLAATARGQEAAPPLVPRQIEIRRPSLPVQMLAPDARALATRLGSGPAASVPPRPRATGGGARTIIVPHPPLANPTPEFLFQDVTDRREPASVVVPPDQRRAAVEAFRQSLAKRKEARR